MRVLKLGVRGKLVILTVGTALFALLLACASFVYYDRTSYAAAKQRTSRVLVESVSNSIFGPAAFQDEDSAKTVLNVLAAEPTAAAAAAYTQDGALLASWRRGASGLPSSLSKARKDGYTADDLQLTAPIRQGDAPPVGYLRVLFSNQDIRQRTARFLQIAGSVLLIAALLAVGLAVAASYFLTRPVKLLYAAATAVQERQDFDVRAARVSDDELGQLTDAFNAMLAMIQARDGELERHRVHLEELVAARTRSLDERNRAMRLVFDNVEQGFVTLDRLGRLGSERSAITERWFGAPAPEATFPEYLAPLAPDYAASFALHWSQLVEGVLPLELNLAQLPSRMQTTQGRYYELAYRPVDVSGDSFAKLLVIVTDVSARIEKERSDAEQAQLMAMFENLANDRGGFSDFLEEANRLVSALTDPAPRELALSLRELHTLKGNFGLFALKPLALLVHGLESDCIERQAPLSNDQKAGLRDAWARFQGRAAAFLGQHPHALNVEREELDGIVEALRRGAGVEQVVRMVQRLADEPVAPKLDRLGQRARELARRLGKGELEVHVQADGVRAEHEHGWLWHILPHAINNSVDHGLPDAAQRGAGTRSTLRLAAREQAGELQVEIEDNGRGIDWEKVRQKGQALGMPVGDTAALVDVVFAQGVSTREAASEVSGRGLGLSALKAACQAHQAKLQLQSQPGRGTLLRFILKAQPQNQNVTHKASRSA